MKFIIYLVKWDNFCDKHIVVITPSNRCLNTEIHNILAKCDNFCYIQIKIITPSNRCLNSVVHNIWKNVIISVIYKLRLSRLLIDV